MARELISKEPIKNFGNIKSEMDRLWDAFLFGKPIRRKRGEDGGWVPAVDVRETKNDIVVNAEIPGMDPKDIEISLGEGVLTIKGERKREREEREESFHLLERNYGTFTRLVCLPKEVQTNKITATYKNGVLSITLPKSEEARKEVKIEVK